MNEAVESKRETLPPLDAAVQELKGILEEKKRVEYALNVLENETYRWNVSVTLGDAKHTFFGMGPDGWNPKLVEIRDAFKAALAVEVERMNREAAKRIAVITEASLGVVTATGASVAPVGNAERKLEAQG